MIEGTASSDQYGPMPKPAVPRIPPQMRPEEIGKRLKEIREAFGLKPAEIADMLDIERTYWSRFERGHRPVTEEVAYLLTERFGVTLDFILLDRWGGLPLDVAEKLRAVRRS